MGNTRQWVAWTGTTTCTRTGTTRQWKMPSKLRMLRSSSSSSNNSSSSWHFTTITYEYDVGLLFSFDPPPKQQRLFSIPTPIMLWATKVSIISYGWGHLGKYAIGCTRARCEYDDWGARHASPVGATFSISAPCRYRPSHCHLEEDRTALWGELGKMRPLPHFFFHV